MKVGFAGAGNMARAMARGWAAGGGPDAMLFCDLDAQRAAALADEVGGETRDSLSEVAAESDVVVLAVKPAALDDAAEALGHKAPAVISVLAATPVARLAEAFPGVPVIRVMPNQAVEVGEGVLCYVPPSDGMPADVASSLITLLGELGMTVPLPEDKMNAAMALMSCSPAYVAQFAEALIAAGEREGLEPDLAADLVYGTLSGTAELLRVRDPAAVREAVASPGGATAAGLDALRKGGFDDALSAAVEASLERFR
jgi:pyrroline-5-carboxylate reductase